MSKTRRRFVSAMLGTGLVGWLASVLYPVFSFLKPPRVFEARVNSIRVGPAADVANNSGTIVKMGRTPVLLVRLEDGEFRAFAATCTHLDCLVQYRDDYRNIWCACHNGHYDLHGRNISGPPPRPLSIYEVQVVDDQVIVSRSQSEA